jgi:hypothetical protein
MTARAMLTRLFSATLLLTLGTALPACDGDSGDGDGGDESSSSTTAANDTGADTGAGPDACDESVAAMACDPNCAFDPAAVNCMNACQNIADQCASDACSASDSCVGLNQDVALCATACEASKNLSCTNVVFGCWDSAGANNCEDVGTCVNMY